MTLAPVEQEICSSISAAETLAMLRDLIRIPSASGDTGAIIGWLEERLRRDGFTPVRLGPSPEWQNLVVTVPGAAPEIGLLLAGHVDTVPVGDHQWQFSPFEAVVQGGTVYGRGAADMKGGLAALLAALSAIARTRPRLKRGVMLALTCDEEVGSQNGMKYLCDHHAVRGRYGVAAECTSLTVQGWFKGRAKYEVVVIGKSAHASNPGRGVNAIVKLAELIVRLSRADLSRGRRHPVLGSAIVNVGIVGGGTDSNSVPDRATAVVEVKMIPGETSDSILRELRRVIEEASSADPQLKADVTLAFAKEPMEIPAASPIVEQIRRITAGVVGTPAPHGSEPLAGGDLYYPWKAFGTQSVQFGPGDIGLAHGVDEAVSIDQVVAAARTYAVLVLRLCGASGDEQGG